MRTTIETSQRYRINVTQTSTGKKGWECTVEMEGGEMNKVLLLSDALVTELERRYPPEETKKPAEKAPKTGQGEGLGTPPALTP